MEVFVINHGPLFRSKEPDTIKVTAMDQRLVLKINMMVMMIMKIMPPILKVRKQGSKVNKHVLTHLGTW